MNNSSSFRRLAAITATVSMPLAFGFVHLNCSEKNVATVPGTVSEFTLHYDQGNLSSPLLAAGKYEAAARFTNAQIGNLVGRDVIEAHYYIAGKPENGDWLYATSDRAWTPLSQRSSISINWNIRAVVNSGNRNTSPP
jgi:hypothetical protein